MSLRKRQEGATLIVTMIMLVIFTLFAVTMISGSGVNLKVVGNMQAKKRVEADAQQAIEQVLSDADNFDPPFDDGAPANQFPQTIALNDSTVNLLVPRCLLEIPVSGYQMGSATQPSLAPLDMVWEVQANAQDPASGAAAGLRQGFRLRRSVGSVCP
ncbi:MAG: pilus assembly PilX family protein [Gammaproteobacteria bacterium]